jgi:hypothetical protein
MPLSVRSAPVRETQRSTRLKQGVAVEDQAQVSSTPSLLELDPVHLLAVPVILHVAIVTA